MFEITVEDPAPGFEKVELVYGNPIAFMSYHHSSDCCTDFGCLSVKSGVANFPVLLVVYTSLLRF